MTFLAFLAVAKKDIQSALRINTNPVHLIATCTFLHFPFNFSTFAE
jgi:hypothetical protein